VTRFSRETAIVGATSPTAVLVTDRLGHLGAPNETATAVLGIGVVVRDLPFEITTIEAASR